MKLRYVSAFVGSLLLPGLFLTTAQANHLTDLSVSPPNLVALPGESVQYGGTVTATTDGCGITSYGTTLSLSGEPAGSSVLFTPAGSNIDDATPYGYTLDIGVAADAAPGMYPLGVTVTWAGPCVTQGTTTEFTILSVLAGDCPSGGGWALFPALSPDDVYDMNGDGYICLKELPEGSMGEGNSANRHGAVDVGHVDGHNHMDNNN